ncbi:MAG: hypothetical protein A3I76_06540 [Elusimicrobia bacterium RIFCSPLOWO2_02_FULL_61_11]|nr:MAG: hypothetical protein A3I76_06540 [Elusimicrobia bacterium RIFCSPLOWO2_02_FULL_61_11]
MKPAKKAAEIFLSGEVYCAEAVELAASVFEGRGVRLVKAAGGFRVEAPGDAAGEFCNEVLNQQCRLDLSRKNYKIASLIATKALLSAAGVEQGGAAKGKEKAAKKK